MSAEHPTIQPPGRSAWYAAVGIDDGREPWADTVDAEEFPTRERARQWAEQAIRAPRALERLRHTQGKDGNEPLLVACLEQVYYRPVAFTHPAYGTARGHRPGGGRRHPGHRVPARRPDHRHLGRARARPPRRWWS